MTTSFSDLSLSHPLSKLLLNSLSCFNQMKRRDRGFQNNYTPTRSVETDRAESWKKASAAVQTSRPRTWHIPSVSACSFSWSLEEPRRIWWGFGYMCTGERRVHKPRSLIYLLIVSFMKQFVCLLLLLLPRPPSLFVLALPSLNQLIRAF